MKGDNVTNAVLLLEDGSAWAGVVQGAFCFDWVFGEVVFNTSMCGYEEILTDPSYAGQIVVMSAPHIGNYGITLEDQESQRVHTKGLIVRELSTIYSSPRGRESLTKLMESNEVPILSGVDTRSLVKHLRNNGVMKGRIIIQTNTIQHHLLELQSYPDVMAFDWVKEVTIAEARHCGTGWPRIVVYDFGCKDGILRSLQGLGCEVVLVPAHTKAENALAYDPHGILLSNGPGDPSVLTTIVNEIKVFIEKKMPLFGICLGHQLLAMALGAKTYKLKFGHRGSNHPVKDLKSGKVLITSHNHGYAVKADSLPEDVEPTFVNLYDQTLEGFRHKTLPLLSVKFHPEGSPGPRDALYLFQEWVDTVKNVKTVSRETFLPIYLKSEKGRYASTN